MNIVPKAFMIVSTALCMASAPGMAMNRDGMNGDEDMDIPHFTGIIPPGQRVKVILSPGAHLTILEHNLGSGPLPSIDVGPNATLTLPAATYYELEELHVSPEGHVNLIDPTSVAHPTPPSH